MSAQHRSRRALARLSAGIAVALVAAACGSTLGLDEYQFDCTTASIELRPTVPPFSRPPPQKPLGERRRASPAPR